jgi:integrase
MFDESMHDPYPEEDPNSLMEHQVPVFLELMRRDYPQFYAMAVFGFVTGLRGTNISALRYRGDEADINWETGVCYVRRAAGRLGETRKNTKQRKRYRITLPQSLLAILRWHIDTQIAKGPPRDSNYLFPSDKGEPRIAQVMNKPFGDCSREMELPFDLSVSGMRRTYHDLAQAAGVKGLVIRSISGHQDAKMQARYTSFWGARQLEALESIMGLVTGKHRRAFIPTPEAALVTEGATSPKEAA